MQTREMSSGNHISTENCFTPTRLELIQPWASHLMESTLTKTLDCHYTKMDFIIGQQVHFLIFVFQKLLIIFQNNKKTASKESLQYALLAAILNTYQNMEKAPQMVPAWLAHAIQQPWFQDMYSKEKIFNLLIKKAQSFEEFDRRFPGFGLYMPWFYIHNETWSEQNPLPTDKWTPALGLSKISISFVLKILFFS